MVRKYKRSYSTRRPLKTVKYSNETTNVTSFVSLAVNALASIPLITASSVQGVRKAKNFSLKVIYAGPQPLIFTLVYVPEGQTPQAINRGSYDQPASLYEPNQNVIMSGYIVPNNSQAQTFRTRLARNLNSGDSVQLLFTCADNSAVVTNQLIGISLNYAITY